MTTRYRRSIFGTFFKCPMPECDGVCRNGTLVLLGHYVCEECFSRFAKVDEETVEIVETIQVDARIVGAVEVLATAGTIHMRQAYVNAAALTTPQYNAERRALAAGSAMPDDYNVMDEYSNARAALDALAQELKEVK